MKTKMTFSKSTKGTHVYASTEDDPAVKTVYVQRGHLPKDPPAKITVTVEYE